MMKINQNLQKGILMLIFSFTMASSQLFAQDTLFTTDNEVIVCKIKNLGVFSVQYYDQNMRNDVSREMDLNLVDKVVFADGEVVDRKKLLNGMTNYDDQHKNVLKFRLLSPLYGYYGFGYEHSIRPGRSYELGLGIIAGNNTLTDYKSSGVSLNVGYKFISTPDFYMAGMRRSHILKGAYVKPEIFLSFYKVSDVYYDYYDDSSGKYEDNVSAFAFLVSVGKQWVFSDQFSVDISAGIGFGSRSDSDVDYFELGTNGGFTTLGGFAYNSTIKVGYLFGK